MSEPVDLEDVAAGNGGFVIYGRDGGDFSGFAVASAGDINGDGIDDLLIGAYGGDGASGAANDDRGESYVIFGKSGGFDAAIDLDAVATGNGGFVINGRDLGDNAGISVASAGDINGDGFDDLIVGAAGGDAAANGAADAGEAYVIFGKAAGFAASIDLATVASGNGGFVINGRDAGDRAGVAVASAGDVNGDGFDDLLIGASGGDGASNSEAGAGEAYLLFGKSSSFGASVELSTIATGSGGFAIYGRDAGDGAGIAVASAGDINGDGFDDLLIGASTADALGSSDYDSGEAYVLFGKSGGFGAGIDLDSIAAGNGGFVINGKDLGDRAGAAVSGAGDVNGDGFDDLVIGAYRAGNATGSIPQSGESYVVFGKSASFGAMLNLADVANGNGGFVIVGRDANDRSGQAVAAAGDVNGDGLADLLVGAPGGDGASNGRSGSGEAYVLFGTASGFGASVSLATVAAGSGGYVIYGRDAQDGSGRALAAAGDINGDGFADLLIAAPGADGDGNGAPDTGEAYVLLGGSGFTAADDSVQLAEDAPPTSVDVLANDGTGATLDALGGITVDAPLPAITAADVAVAIVSGEIAVTLGADFALLGAEETATVTVGYTAKDGSGNIAEASLVVTVLGEAPAVIGAVDDNATVSEGAGSATYDVLANDDAGAGLTGVGALTVDAPLEAIDAADVSAAIVDGELVVTLGDDFTLMDEGESATVTVPYAIGDGAGAEGAATLTLTVSGRSATASDDEIDLSGPGGGSVIGGRGDDEFVVDDPEDLPEELPDEGIDTVFASISWVLGPNFENLVLTGTGDIDGTGNELANTLTGNSGRNRLDGGSGADTLIGGAGGDTYFVDHPGDTVIETANPAALRALRSGDDDRPLDAAQDADTIVASLGRAVLSAFVENGVLAEGSAAREVIGNVLANSAEGNSAGNLLAGGGGNDTLSGGAGMDVAAFTGTRADYTITVDGDAVTVTDNNGADGDDGSDTLTGIEALRFANTVITIGGASLLTGSARADTIDLSAAGAQVAWGGAGNDLYLVDASGDAVVEQSKHGTDTVQASASWTLWENVEHLLLTGTADIDGAGNAGANKLTGNAGANRLLGYAGADKLDGGAGADTLEGGAGNDLYFVGSAADVVIERALEGTDRVRSSVSFDLPEHVEKLILTGDAGIDGSGNEANNTLTGNKAANRLEGGAGNDTLTGGLGADTLVGGAGDDSYVVAIGDILIETSTGGTDTVRSAGDWTLTEGVENLVLLGTRNSNATGNSNANALTGNSAANVLAGGSGNDVLIGGNGNDVLRGGAGGDRLTGGLGADVFVFDTPLSAAANTDRITDFSTGSDRIRLDNDVFTTLATGALGAAQFVAGAGLLSGQDVDDRIVYNTTTGALYYDPDGSGAAKAVQFAILGATTHPVLAAADFFVVD